MTWAIVMGVIALFGTVALMRVVAAASAGFAPVPVQTLKESRRRIDRIE